MCAPRTHRHGGHSCMVGSQLIPHLNTEQRVCTEVTRCRRGLQVCREAKGGKDDHTHGELARWSHVGRRFPVHLISCCWRVLVIDPRPSWSRGGDTFADSCPAFRQMGSQGPLLASVVSHSPSAAGSPRANMAYFGDVPTPLTQQRSQKGQ